MKTTITFLLIFAAILTIAQSPVEVKLTDKLLITNESDTSQISIKSNTQSSVIDLQGANTSTIRFMQNNVSKAEVRLIGNNFDLYSMPPVTFPQLRTPTLRMTPERLVGINKGLLSPTEVLDVNGRLKIGYREGVATPGVLRYNPDEKKFESYNGANWKSFGSLSLDDDGDSGISMVESGIDSIVFKVNGNEEMRFGGHSLELGKDGNTYIGKGVTPIDDPLNIGNTVTGWLSARSMNSGVSNTIYGFRSSEVLNTGDFNTIVGSQTANQLTFGSMNTYLGYRAGWNSGAGNSGNVYLGYRAGEGFIGSNRLVIANSETTTPLIDGNFASGLLKINGETELKGNTVIEGNTTITGLAGILGATIIHNQLTAQDIKIDDNNPFLEFSQLGNSQFYFQYQSTNDQFVLVETGLGEVFKIRNGQVYLPTLAGQAGKLMELDNQGKISFEEEVVNPVLTYYGTQFYGRSDGGNANYLDLTQSFKENNKTSIGEVRVRFNWSEAIDKPELNLVRVEKSTGNLDFFAEVSGTIGGYNMVFTEIVNQQIDLNTYNYYMFTFEELTEIIEIEID